MTRYYIMLIVTKICPRLMLFQGVPTEICFGATSVNKQCLLDTLVQHVIGKPKRQKDRQTDIWIYIKAEVKVAVILSQNVFFQ